MSAQTNAANLKKEKRVAHDSKGAQGKLRHTHTRLRCNLAGANGKRFPEQSVASECECVSKSQESAVWLADGLRAERSSAALFSCNNAITGPGRGAAAKACQILAGLDVILPGDTSRSGKSGAH